MTRWIALWLARCFAGALAAIAVPATAQVTQAFDAQVPHAPVIADTGGTAELVHELHLTNFAGQALNIQRITVLDAETGVTIGEAEGAALDGWMGRAGAGGDDNVRRIAPGMRALVYFNLPLADSAPRAIVHRIDFRFAQEEDQAQRQISIAPTTIDAPAPLVLGPPLRGGPWAAVYAPEMERGHRRVVYAIDGQARIPGRFAIDFIKLDDAGRSAPAGTTRLDQFHGHGEAVLAVADAVVAAVRDDMAEAETLAAVPRVGIADASGNYVALDLGDGRFAFYEHLRPGIVVRPGQRVRRGDVIGHLGLTGQGSEPHLHFHVASANSVLGAEGLPFLLERFVRLGGYPSIAAFARGGPWDRAGTLGPVRAMTPSPNTVLRFPD